ncbi:ABC transporter permease [Cupriavidus taiwanensis]|uniref:ABC transport system, membrane component n=1 Tax=Cupriavidus taiwanensis (strain DSM 17343 / BCRC 17206 / CCUG 44338 / CIP 107171 / LMG 19424 / R1) TaxID=977880 RepID=B3R3K9_CUPTR|nr:ABC transporter permease [Cupriavidus taiwanensis]CAQ68847.1 putative ABC transport system, membrane component [Cupriavidus taiwanensis LMG 19424]SOY55968.1 putative ABC transport system, membrane component [Cupriavidus taiwanensis]SPC06739.1 putative glucose ABC transporter permease protein TsgC13 [Cupriavidus taiwanensis]
MEQLAPLIATAINAGTPLLLAALGLLINERSGVLNLGAEGMMLVAAVAGFMVGYQTQSPMLGFAAGALAGMLMATLFSWLALVLATNQVATGLALSIFGTGLSAFMGQRFVGYAMPAQAKAVPGLADLPFVGPAFFQHHWMVYFSLLLCFAIMWFLFRTRAGLTLRAIGESPESAHALGYPVRTIRFGALLFGGACCGLAGAYLSLVYTPMWVENLVAGRGWIALALTTFATWRPGRVLVGAWLFGAVTILQFYLQGIGVAAPPQFLSMLPYAATIVVLALISRNPAWIRLNMPASLGKPFRPGSA